MVGHFRSGGFIMKAKLTRLTLVATLGIFCGCFNQKTESRSTGDSNVGETDDGSVSDVANSEEAANLLKSGGCNSQQPQLPQESNAAEGSAANPQRPVCPPGGAENPASRKGKQRPILERL